MSVLTLKCQRKSFSELNPKFQKDQNEDEAMIIHHTTWDPSSFDLLEDKYWGGTTYIKSYTRACKLSQMGSPHSKRKMPQLFGS